MVADPSLHPHTQRIIRGLERLRYEVGLTVVQNIESGRAEAGKGLIEGFVNRTAAGELIVRNRIDSWRRAKRIENDRNTARRRSRRTDRIIVEIERAIKERCLARVVEEPTQQQILKRLVTLGHTRGGGYRIGIEKLTIHHPVNRRLIHSTIIVADDARRDPQTGPLIFSIGQLISVGIPNRAEKNLRCEHPAAERQPFFVFTGWRNLRTPWGRAPLASGCSAPLAAGRSVLGKRRRYRTHDQSHGYS